MRTVLIDANHLLSRTFHVPSFQHLKCIVDNETVFVGATFGFLNSLRIIASTYPSDIMVVVWDGGGSNFRKEIYAEYKANREPRSNEFIYQLQLTKEFLTLLGVRQIQISNTEADDIIGVLTKKSRKFGYKVLIISGDKDFNQLVSQNVNVVNPRQGEDGADRIMTPEVVKERYGIPPSLFVDYLALNGDSTDNINGIDGIGKKTSKELIQCNGNIEDIVKVDIHYKFASDGVKKPISSKLQEKINKHKEQLILNKKLVTICTDMDITVDSKVKPDFLKLKTMFKKYEFNSFIREFETFVANFS